MADLQTNTPAQVPESTPQPVVSTATSATPREEIYRQYYSNQQPPTPPEESPVEPVVDPNAAPVEPSATPAPNPLEAKVAQLEQQLVQTLQVLDGMVRQARTPVQPQPPGVPAKEAPGKWIELLRDGKIEEAEEELFKKFAARTVEQAKTASTAESLEIFRVEQEIQRFVNDLRTSNPDLASLEEMIGYKAQAYLEASMNSGRVNNAGEYVTAYKDAVNKAVGEARNFVQSVRATGIAAGKTEAQTVQREVLSAAPVVAGKVQPERGALPQKPTSQPETASDYVKRRQMDQQRKAGMLVG